jgi:hypothetical protein
MLYAGLGLGRKRLDFHLLDEEGATVEVGALPPDADGLRGLSERLDRHGAPIRAAIESMNGARFVHDRLELHGWQVEIADAQKVKGLATPVLQDRPHRRLGAVRARPPRSGAGVWLPDPRVRAERERARCGALRSRGRDRGACQPVPQDLSPKLLSGLITASCAVVSRPGPRQAASAVRPGRARSPGRPRRPPSRARTGAPCR